MNTENEKAVRDPMREALQLAHDHTLTPANAEAELEALMMKVAHAVRESLLNGGTGFDYDLRAIVQAEIKGEGGA